MAKQKSEGVWFIKRTPLDRILYGLNILLLTLLCLAIIFPFLNILALSFNDGKDAMQGGVYLWPRKFSLDNYAEVFSDDSIMRGYVITIARTVIGTVSSVFLTAMAAYVMRTQGLPGKGAMSIFLLITMLFSGGTIPYYIVLKQIGLINSFWVYVLPNLYSAWNIVIMRTFFQGISYSLEESAKLDGCTDFGVFMKIYLPLSKPVIAVIGLMNGVGHWNDWFSGAYYVTKKELRPVQTLVQEMLQQSERLQKMMQSSSQAMSTANVAVTSESLKMATIVISILPILFIYPFCQKYFAKGVMIGAVKE